MYDDLIKRLRALAEKQFFKFESAPYLEAADAIENLLAQRNENYADSWKMAYELERDEHRWIPINERLPEVNVWVQTYRTTEQIWPAFLTSQNEWIDEAFRPLTNITHWMPLPEPPEEE